LKTNKLHIVALDVPFPADYGGAIDMFYRIKALHELGLELTIHVFEYGRGKQTELEKYGKVIYYPRKKGLLQNVSLRPFIVQSRKSQLLLKNLLVDHAPILFEGIHTTWCLEDKRISERRTFVRMHNLEHEYYQGLKKNASWFKKQFFRLESIKLKRYQSILSRATHILAIKDSDADELLKINSSTHVLPASIPDVKGCFGTVERYALFHGNLSVPENERSALWIIDTLDSVLDQHFELIIAGKNPSKKLQKACIKAGIELISNPSDDKLRNLIQEAQIHVLYTPVASGVKLKLLTCMHSPGQILLNGNMLGNSALAPFCKVANTPKEFKMHFLGLQNKALTIADYEARVKFMDLHFNNCNNCKLIVKLLDHE
jgi:hypothetical protein